ncbi:MAG: hypothetical protein KBT88_11440 [Gammaproteobacteria bacterium]|nr:hypothetical protein [Gammaproteobacteria bacterium]MBQ0840389.1 hypothetical protein [Gammaproteobacteria bacterium]
MRISTARWALLLCIATLLAACSSEQDKWLQQLNQQASVTSTKLERLKQHIDAGQIANTRVLSQYAAVIRTDRPELADLSAALAQDASPEGPIIRSLQSRLSDAQSDIPNVVTLSSEQVNKVYQELSAIEAAAQPDTYGMMLSDPINVLADMSEGKLARVAAMSAEASARINDAEDFGPGSQLVGNPQYGSWQSNSSGTSFWHWYGQYAFFSSMFRSPISYGSWGRGRDYSYYNDYGRSAYTSPSQRQNQQTTERSTRNKFKSSGKKFSSPYASTKQTTASVARKSSKFQPKSLPSSRSIKSAKSTTSNYRSSTYQSSRSSFGGK